MHPVGVWPIFPYLVPASHPDRAFIVHRKHAMHHIRVRKRRRSSVRRNPFVPGHGHPVREHRRVVPVLPPFSDHTPEHVPDQQPAVKAGALLRLGVFKRRPQIILPVQIHPASRRAQAAHPSTSPWSRRCSAPLHRPRWEVCRARGKIGSGNTGCPGRAVHRPCDPWRTPGTCPASAASASRAYYSSLLVIASARSLLMDRIACSFFTMSVLKYA